MEGGHGDSESQRRGFGWKRWSKEWLYGTAGLYIEYHVRGDGIGHR